MKYIFNILLLLMPLFLQGQKYYVTYSDTIYVTSFDTITEEATSYPYYDALFHYEADSFSLGTWKDTEGNKDATGDNPPTLIANQLNGYPVVRFDGINDYLNIDTTLDTYSFDIFIVCKYNDLYDDGFHAMFSTEGNTFFLGHKDDEKLWVQLRDYVGGVTTYNRYSTPHDTLYYTINYRYDHDQRKLEIWSNYGRVLCDTAIEFIGTGGNTFYIGSKAGTFPIEADVAEIIWYNKILTWEQRDVVVDYTIDKYNHTTKKTCQIGAGQSNWNGEADTAGLSAEYKNKIPSKIWTGSGFDVLQATGGLNNSHYPVSNTQYVGANIPTGKEYYDQYSDTLYWLQYAVGGTALYPNAGTDWSVQSAGENFSGLIKVIDDANAHLSPLGYQCEYEGFNWDQGESDSYDSTRAANYKSGLIALIDSVRTRIGFDIPVIGGRPRKPIGAGSDFYFPVVRQAYSDLSDSSDYKFEYIDRDNFSYKDDNVHLDTNGIELYADSIIEEIKLINQSNIKDKYAIDSSVTYYIYYDLSETALMHLNGTVSTINNKIGTVFDENNTYNAVQTDTSKSPSLVDGSWGFDGTDDYLEIADDNSLRINDKFTISVWVYASSFPSPGNTIIAKRDGNSLYYHLRASNTGEVILLLHDGTSLDVLTFGYTLPTSQWKHLDLIRDENNISLYVDGNYKGSNTSSLDISANDDITFIGAYTYGNQVWSGLIDEVKIYDRPLRKAEIQELYNSCDTAGGILNCNY